MSLMVLLTSCPTSASGPDFRRYRRQRSIMALNIVTLNPKLKMRMSHSGGSGRDKGSGEMNPLLNSKFLKKRRLTTRRMKKMMKRGKICRFQAIDEKR